LCNKITACMMVKDGGELFRNALTSIAGMVDALVVVNTAEERDTPDTAAVREFSLKNNTSHVIIHSPWREDFSFHRNQSLEPVHHGWCLILDADEELKFPNGPDGFKKELEAVPPEAWAIDVPVHDVRGGKSIMVMNQPRLFRAGMLEYHQAVHNQVRRKDGGEDIRYVAHGLEVEHYGYDQGHPGVDIKVKRKRRVSMLERELEHGNWDALFYLAQDYGIHGDIDAALDYWERYRSTADALGFKMKTESYFPAARRYKDKGDYEAAARWLEAGLKARPDDLDLSHLKSELAQELMVDAVKEQNMQDAAAYSSAMVQASIDYVQFYNEMKLRGMKDTRWVYTAKPEIYLKHLCIACTYRLFVGQVMWQEAMGLARELDPDLARACQAQMRFDLSKATPGVFAEINKAANQGREENKDLAA
jgi:hypothetical protein